ncbi:MAG: hypothetical protein ACLFPG_04370 [Desulfohalobiaceae bacterium]
MYSWPLSEVSSRLKPAIVVRSSLDMAFAHIVLDNAPQALVSDLNNPCGDVETGIFRTKVMAACSKSKVNLLPCVWPRERSLCS